LWLLNKSINFFGDTPPSDPSARDADYYESNLVGMKEAIFQNPLVKQRMKQWERDIKQYFENNPNEQYHHDQQYGFILDNYEHYKGAVSDGFKDPYEFLGHRTIFRWVMGTGSLCYYAQIVGTNQVKIKWIYWDPFDVKSFADHEGLPIDLAHRIEAVLDLYMDVLLQSEFMFRVSKTEIKNTSDLGQ
jgi:hypothetical protein